MGDVRNLFGTPPNDPLMSLPECKLEPCRWCGAPFEGEGAWQWWTVNLGCSVCSPKNEQASNEMSHHASRASSLADRLRRILEPARRVLNASRGALVRDNDLRDLRAAIAQHDQNERIVPMLDDPCSDSATGSKEGEKL